MMMWFTRDKSGLFSAHPSVSKQAPQSKEIKSVADVCNDPSHERTIARMKAQPEAANVKWGSF